MRAKPSSTVQELSLPLRRRPVPIGWRDFRAPSIVLLLVACLTFVPRVNHMAKRALGIPSELSGPHTAAEAGGSDKPIPGSRDFAFCALSRAPQAAGTCLVTQQADGWHINSVLADANQDCAALCLK